VIGSENVYVLIIVTVNGRRHQLAICFGYVN
jgi:hypothetical protein